MFIRAREFPSHRERERDAELRVLHGRLSIAKNRRDKVAMQNVEKEIKAVHRKYLWPF